MADLEWVRAFATVARDLARATDPKDVLSEIAKAATVVSGCPWAAVAMARHDSTPTVAATSELATASTIAEIQSSGGGGPTWEAVRSGNSIYVPDLSLETRWPEHVRGLLDDTPVRSILAFCLRLDDEPLGALTLYGDRPDAFPAGVRARASVYADHAALALDRIRAGAKAANLEIALRTSRQIGIALGILVERHKLSPDQAFEMLRVASQRYHRKLRDVADDLVFTGVFNLPTSAAGKTEHED